MRYKFLGATGLQVSEFSLGCMNFADGKTELGMSSVSTEAAFELMKVCFEHGVNFFDNAEVYGGVDGVSERVMGAAIRMGIERGVWKRKELVISTKLFGGTMGRTQKKPNPNVQGLSRKHLTEGLLESLARMQLDYVDLLFCHRPDPSVRIEETVRAMNDLILRGLVFYWGTSEWSAQQLQEAITVARELGLEPPFFDQTQYSIIERKRIEREYAPLYPNLGTTIWSPLAGGVLAGKYTRGSAPPGSRYAGLLKAKEKGSKNPMMKAMLDRFERNLDVADNLKPIAKELGCSVSQLCLAWAASNPHVSTVIMGASTIEQLKENLAAIPVVAKLTPEVLKNIESAAGTKPPLDEISAALTHRKSRL